MKDLRDISRRFCNLKLLLVLLLTVSCSRFGLTNYKATVRSGLAVLPWPRQMEALFGEGDHFITEYGFAAGPRQWNSEVFFGGRYSLTLQVDVEVDYSSHLVGKVVSAPKFYLNEFGSVVRVKGGGVAAFGSNGWTFDEAQWNKLVAAKGDWSVIGIPVKKDDPVSGFDDYVKKLREPRVKVK